MVSGGGFCGGDLVQTEIGSRLVLRAMLFWQVSPSVPMLLGQSQACCFLLKYMNAGRWTERLRTLDDVFWKHCPGIIEGGSSEVKY